MTNFVPKAIRLCEESIPLILAIWPEYTEESLRNDLSKDVNYVFVENVELTDALIKCGMMTEKAFNKQFEYKDEASNSELRQITYL